jgi:hypothetical protein
VRPSQTPAGILFVTVVTVVGTALSLMVIYWFIMWVLDAYGGLVFAVVCIGGTLLMISGGIAWDIKKGLYRFRDLPGALFKKYPGAYD